MAENSHPKEMEMRGAFGRTLVDLGREEPRIVVLDADLNTSSKTVLFKKAFPDRFFQVGIAEQNLFGVAAGLASGGIYPIPFHVCRLCRAPGTGPDCDLDLLPESEGAHPGLLCRASHQPSGGLPQLH